MVVQLVELCFSTKGPRFDRIVIKGVACNALYTSKSAKWIHVCVDYHRIVTV